jgi:hypothetical protein
MSSSSAAVASKRLRVESKSDQQAHNSFSLVPSKYLSEPLQRSVLSFLELWECCELVTMSKDVYKLVQTYMQSLRAVTIDETTDAFCVEYLPLLFLSDAAEHHRSLLARV